MDECRSSSGHPATRQRGTLALLSAIFSYCILYDVTGFGTGKE
jgi:hypothetical protein